MNAYGHNFEAGKVIKKATAVNEGQKRSVCRNCKMQVTESIPKLQPRATLSKTKITLKKKKTTTIKVSKMAYGDSVKSWTSNNKKVATVNKKGKIRAIRTGKATITVTLKSGLKKKVKVTVK